MLHLFNKDSHARFLAFCKPGYYGITIDISIAFDKDLGPQARQTLQQRQGKARWLQVTLGKSPVKRAPPILTPRAPPPLRVRDIYGQNSKKKETVATAGNRCNCWKRWKRSKTNLFKVTITL